MKRENTILVVLGYPADDDGNPGPILKARLDKAIELYRNGTASKMIVTGAAVDNQFVESEVMAVYCINNGIPAEDIFVESSAKNTYENAKMVHNIMLSKGYTDAVVVTSSFHKLRARQFFSRHMSNFRIVTAPFPANFSVIKRVFFLLKEFIILILFRLGLLNARYSIQ